MFTQTELHGIDHQLRRFEEVAYPTGVVLVAAGRLASVALLARIGGVLVVVSLLGFGVILGRRLYETQVDWTPMLSRYSVVVPAMVLWAILALPVWLADPLARNTVFGAPGTAHLLVLGVVGFVVLGTLYHIVPFIIWVHRYSDRLGYEAVPMIEDLYDDRLAAVDFALLAGGTAVLVAADLLSLPSMVPALGGIFVLAGALLFLTNIVRVIRTHSPHSLAGVLFDTFQADPDSSSDESIESADTR
jgi:hypothetical protein